MRERLETPDGRLIGFYSPATRLWTRAGVRPAHLMRLFGDTPGFDADTFDRLMLLGLGGLWAWNKDTSWRVAAHIFDLNKAERDYGHGRQYFLPRRFWLVEEGHGKRAPGAGDSSLRSRRHGGARERFGRLEGPILAPAH